jgi:tape measure domain-containing protein
MLAMGFSAKEVMPTLTAIGDASSGLGLGAEGLDRITRALGQMRAKGKVSAEEMLQLTEAGVPAWAILSKAIGKSTDTGREHSQLQTRQ